MKKMTSLILIFNDIIFISMSVIPGVWRTVRSVGLSARFIWLGGSPLKDLIYKILVYEIARLEYLDIMIS